MLKREFYVHFVARPRTKEYFDLSIHPMDMRPVEYCRESIQLYLDDMFWNDYEFDERSIYSVGLRVIVDGHYWHSSYGDEYEEDVFSEKLYMNRASDLRVLRDFLETKGLVQRKERHSKF